MKWHFKKQVGFTLVELMVVIVILGILLSLGVVKFASARDRARQASTKTNMHAFRTVVEVYATHYNGLYPDSVQNLLDDDATRNEKVLFDMGNPYSLRSGRQESYADESYTPKKQGLVTMAFDGVSVGYTLYGYDKDASKITHRGVIYALSNH